MISGSIAILYVLVNVLAIQLTLDWITDINFSPHNRWTSFMRDRTFSVSLNFCIIAGLKKRCTITCNQLKVACMVMQD